MRDVFMRELIKAARANPDVILMVGDLGYSVVEEFQAEFPERFFNAGIAEQNMMGMAAGLASEGCQVFTYSIGNFPTWRCAEQVRNDVDYHKLSVVNVVVGGGVTYGPLGYSHHAIQDYALMRSLPNMTIASPGDRLETEAVCRYIMNSSGPFYLRLGKGDHQLNANHEIVLTQGRMNLVRDGDDDNVVVTTGNVLLDTLNEDSLAGRSIYSLPLWSSFSKSLVQAQLSNFKSVVTVEDHLLDGGFGSWVREAMNGVAISGPSMTNLAFDASICGQVGSPENLRQQLFRSLPTSC